MTSTSLGTMRRRSFDPGEDIELLEQLGLDESSMVVDLGSGTGTFAVAAAELGASVTAVDVSPVMAHALRRRAADSGPATLKVVEAGFLSYRHEGTPADFVFTRNALHQLPDFWKVVALRQVGRMLRPDVVLRLRDPVFDLEADRIEETIEAWMGFAVPQEVATQGANGAPTRNCGQRRDRGYLE